MFPEILPTGPDVYYLDRPTDFAAYQL